MKLRIGVFVAVVVITALAFALWPRQKTAPSTAMPSPNGYEDFLAATRLDAYSAMPDLKTATKLELEEALNRESKRLELTHAGLLKESRVTVTNGMNYIVAHIESLGRLKALAKLLEAEARLAEIQGANGGAGKAYINLIRFGQKLSDGGLLVDRSMGIAVEAVGINGLHAIIPKLSVDECSQLIRELAVIDESHEEIAATIAREHAWSNEIGGWRTRLIRRLRPNLAAGAETRITQSALASQTRLREQEVALAAHAFELDTKRRPTGYGDLVPKYLPRIPKDASTGLAATYVWN